MSATVFVASAGRSSNLMALAEGLPVSCEVHVSISSDPDILVARQKGRAMAAQLGYLPPDPSVIANVISELGRNIVLYAREGEISSLKDRLPPSQETVLYRTVQEALANVARHSRATRAEVILELKERMLCCTVRDNGVGCGSAFLTGDMHSTGLGLIGIRERLASVGGTLDIGSHLGRGTQLKMTIHLGGRYVYSRASGG